MIEIYGKVFQGRANYCFTNHYKKFNRNPFALELEFLEQLVRFGSKIWG